MITPGTLRAYHQDQSRERVAKVIARNLTPVSDLQREPSGVRAAERHRSTFAKLEIRMDAAHGVHHEEEGLAVFFEYTKPRAEHLEWATVPSPSLEDPQTGVCGSCNCSRVVWRMDNG